MRIYYRHILFLLLVLLVVSCEKEETPIVLPQPEGEKFEFDLGEHYTNQVYVNLDHGALNTVSNNDWDLAFDCDPKKYGIYMNGGKSTLIANLGQLFPVSYIDVHSLKWEWDSPNGHQDSLALRDWCDGFGNSYGLAYVIDRGPNYSDDKRYYQFSLLGGNYYYYHIMIADLNGQNVKITDIYRDHTKNQVYFSFDNWGEVLNFEPEINAWDFCFLRCRWVYYEFNPPLLYSVAGTQINSQIIQVAIDSTTEFNEIGITHFSNYQFNNNRDAVGFDWKVPIFKPTGVTYRTRDYVTYLIRKRIPHRPEQLYKLRFIDFYSNTGNKGNPVYELVRLK